MKQTQSGKFPECKFQMVLTVFVQNQHLKLKVFCFCSVGRLKKNKTKNYQMIFLSLYRNGKSYFGPSPLI